jgi:hypothetical protein
VPEHTYNVQSADPFGGRGLWRLSKDPDILSRTFRWEPMYGLEEKRICPAAL